jgi:hypothetical protein
LAISLAKLPFLSGQAALTRGLSFAIFQIVLFVSPARRAH